MVKAGDILYHPRPLPGVPSIPPRGGIRGSKPLALNRLPLFCRVRVRQRTAYCQRRRGKLVDRLNTNQDLAAVGPLVSSNGLSRLALQADGNVVLYRSSGVARWASGTSNAVSAEARSA